MLKGDHNQDATKSPEFLVETLLLLVKVEKQRDLYSKMKQKNDKTIWNSNFEYVLLVVIKGSKQEKTGYALTSTAVSLHSYERLWGCTTK